MGVDAVLFVRTKRVYSREEVLDLSYRMCAALGADEFMLDRERNKHALSLCGSTIEANIWYRYYGIGYERGSWPGIYAVARWLAGNIEGTVYYGGDSSDPENFATFDSQQEELWDHFLKVGHFPYTGGLDDGMIERVGDDEICRPICNLCKKPSIRYGFGGNYAAFNCPGCGEVWKTNDKGHTWEIKSELQEVHR